MLRIGTNRFIANSAAAGYGRNLAPEQKKGGGRDPPPLFSPGLVFSSAKENDIKLWGSSGAGFPSTPVSVEPCCILRVGVSRSFPRKRRSAWLHSQGAAAVGRSEPPNTAAALGRLVVAAVFFRSMPCSGLLPLASCSGLLPLDALQRSSSARHGAERTPLLQVRKRRATRVR